MLENYFPASRMLGHLRSGPSGLHLDGFAHRPFFNVWSVDAAHLPGELDCRPLFRPHAGGRGFEPVFRASIWLKMGARENGLSGGFLERFSNDPGNSIPTRGRLYTVG
jgi:hypothetical protein